MRTLFSPLLALVLLVGLAASATAQQQRSIRFTGNAIPDQDRVTIRIDPHVPADVGLDFTIEFWMKANAADNPSGSNGSSTCSNTGENWIRGRIIIDRAIFNHDRHGDYGLAIFRSGNSATLAFGLLKLVPGRENIGLCGSRNVADGQWHHVAVTRNATTGFIQIWVDGTPDPGGSGIGPTGDISYENGVPSSADPGNLQRDNFLGFGAEKFDASAVEYPSYRGWMDDVRISSVVRYTQNFTRPGAPHPNNAGTVALYRFDEGSGTAIVDENNNQSPGVLRPPATWSTDTPFGVQPPQPGTLQFTSSTYSVGEGVAGGTQAITVSRIGGSSGAASVSFAVAQGTATANADYAPPGNSTLSWNDGEGANKSFNVTIINDQSPESNETVNLALSSPSGATLGNPDDAVLTILDNDTTQAGSFRFLSSTSAVGEGAGTSTISVQRVNGSDGAVSVGFATTASGSATAGADYVATSGTLDWIAGDTSDKVFAVAISEDATVEGNETVSLALNTPTGGASIINPSAATLTITDNDVAQPLPPPPAPPPAGGGGGGGGSIEAVTLLALLLELARRHLGARADAAKYA